MPKKHDSDAGADEEFRDDSLSTSRLTYDQMVQVYSGGVHRIVIVAGTQLGHILEVHKHPITIGRDPTNSFVLDEAGISRNHCTLLPTDEGVLLRDSGSKNGTFVNRGHIKEHLLQDGDMIYLGDTTLKFLADHNVEHSYYEYLYQASVEDPVTGIPNRRYFDEFLRREIARTLRYGRDLSLLMIDIDHFKRVNDSLGHVCGDKILHSMANLISSRLRESEFLARYGGEEFALILPETDLRGAAIIGESIRVMVEKHSFVCGKHATALTISIGAALLTPEMKVSADLVKVADKCLYEAKDAGRNQLVGPK